MATDLTYKLKLTTDEVSSALNALRKSISSIDAKINTKGIASDLSGAAKNGAAGIKNEFNGLGLGNLLKSQIISGLAVQGISSAVQGITNALKSGFEKGLNVESQFTSLKTIFKGVEADAKKASQEINKFATETPYSVSQVTDAYIKLKNYGLDSSEKALRSFGNTASALGKPLNQMVEAVADAGTGQFERLKEFGIKSQVEGDKVKFTFDGVTTTVGKNSKEITDYLTTIGETKFAGGMEAQSKTLSGTLSTLGDSFDTVLYKILGVENGIVVQGGVFDQLRNGASFLLKTLSDPTFLLSVDGVTKGIINGFGSATEFISKIDFDSLVSQSQNLLTGLQPVFSTLQDLIFGAFDKIKNINFGDLGKRIIDIFGKIDIGSIASIFDKIKTSIGNALGKIDLNKTIDGLTSFATGVVDLGTKIVGSEIFKATIGTAIDLLVAGFDKLTQIDTTLFVNALKFVGEGLTTISQNQLAVDVITGFGIALGGLAIIGTIAGWVTTLITGFVGIGAIIAPVTAGFVAFFAPVTAGFAVIAGVVGTVFTAIAGFVAFVGLTPILIGLAVAGIVLAFVLNFELIKTITFGFVGAINTFFIGLGTNILITVSSLWANIVAIWTTGSNLISTIITTVFDGIKVILSVVFLTIVAIFTGNTGLLISVWSNFGNTINSLWTSAVGVITNTINFLWTTAKNLFSSGVNALQNYITNFIPNVTNNFNNLKNTVTNTITGLWESAKSKFTEGVNGIKTAVEGMVSNVGTKFNDLKNKIVQTVQDIDLYSMGTNIVQGLINGIRNMGGQVSGALSGIVSGAVNDAKNFLGIKSPSRLMMQVGKFTGEGLVIGIDKMANSAMESMKNLVSLPPVNSFDLQSKTAPNLDLASVNRPQPRASFGNSNSNTTNNNQRTETRVTNNYNNAANFPVLNRAFSQ